MRCCPRSSGRQEKVGRPLRARFTCEQAGGQWALGGQQTPGGRQAGRQAGRQVAWQCWPSPCKPIRVSNIVFNIKRKSPGREACRLASSACGPPSQPSAPGPARLHGRAIHPHAVQLCIQLRGEVCGACQLPQAKRVGIHYNCLGLQLPAIRRNHPARGPTLHDDAAGSGSKASSLVTEQRPGRDCGSSAWTASACAAYPGALQSLPYHLPLHLGPGADGGSRTPGSRREALRDRAHAAGHHHPRSISTGQAALRQAHKQ